MPGADGRFGPENRVAAMTLSADCLKDGLRGIEFRRSGDASKGLLTPPGRANGSDRLASAPVKLEFDARRAMLNMSPLESFRVAPAKDDVAGPTALPRFELNFGSPAGGDEAPAAPESGGRNPWGSPPGVSDEALPRFGAARPGIRGAARGRNGSPMSLPAPGLSPSPWMFRNGSGLLRIAIMPGGLFHISEASSNTGLSPVPCPSHDIFFCMNACIARLLSAFSLFFLL